MHDNAVGRSVAFEKLPASHGRGDDAPSSQYEPASHGTQPVAFCLGWNEPGSHGSHSLLRFELA